MSFVPSISPFWKTVRRLPQVSLLQSKLTSRTSSWFFGLCFRLPEASQGPALRSCIWEAPERLMKWGRRSVTSLHAHQVQKTWPTFYFPTPQKSLTKLIQLLHSVKTTVGYSELKPWWLKTPGNPLTLCDLLFLKQVGGLYGKSGIKSS